MSVYLLASLTIDAAVRSRHGGAPPARGSSHRGTPPPRTLLDVRSRRPHAENVAIGVDVHPQLAAEELGHDPHRLERERARLSESQPQRKLVEDNVFRDGM